MKFLTQRTIFYTFATQEIDGSDAIKVWRVVAGLFGVSPEEIQSGEARLTSPTLAHLKTAEDVRLLQKCADGFGNAFRLSADDEELLELKFQALFKLRQLAGEYRTTPLKAVASAYRSDPVAAVLYALQILIHNGERSSLGCDILSEALSSEQSSDAGLLLLNLKHGDKNSVYAKLSETPEMILHPEQLRELAEKHGLKPETTGRNAKIGF